MHGPFGFDGRGPPPCGTSCASELCCICVTRRRTTTVRYVHNRTPTTYTAACSLTPAGWYPLRPRPRSCASCSAAAGNAECRHERRLGCQHVACRLHAGSLVGWLAAARQAACQAPGAARRRRRSKAVAQQHGRRCGQLAVGRCCSATAHDHHVCVCVVMIHTVHPGHRLWHCSIHNIPYHVHAQLCNIQYCDTCMSCCVRG